MIADFLVWSFFYVSMGSIHFLYCEKTKYVLNRIITLFCFLLWLVLVGKIFEEVLKVDCCEVGVDEGEDDPVWEADLLHDFVNLPAQVAFLSCWEKEHFLTGVFQFLLWRESKLKLQLCMEC